MKGDYKMADRKVTRIGIITPRSLERYGEIFKEGFDELDSEEIKAKIEMPEEGEDATGFTTRIRAQNYDVYIVQLHGAHNEEPVAFNKFRGRRTIILVHRPEEVILRYQKEVLRQLFKNASKIVLLGKAMVREYKRRFCNQVVSIPHGFFNIKPKAIETKDLSIRVVGSVTTWSDMRWIIDVVELIGEIRRISPNTKVVGYVAGKFVPYMHPETGEVVDELESLRNSPDCLLFSAQEIETAYHNSEFKDLASFKQWLYGISNQGKQVLIIEGEFSNEELKGLQSSLIDFNTQIYRELLKDFRPKVEYSGTLHERPGDSIPIVFESPSMSDVESEGLHMITTNFLPKGPDFKPAAKEIIDLTKNPDRCNELLRESLQAAKKLSMRHIAQMYTRLIS